MEELKHQREMVIRQQKSVVQLKVDESGLTVPTAEMENQIITSPKAVRR